MLAVILCAELHGPSSPDLLQYFRVLLTSSFYKHLAVKTLFCHYNCCMWYKVNTVCIPGAASTAAGGIYFQCNNWHNRKMDVILTWCGDVSYHWKLRVRCNVEILRSSGLCNRQTDITDRALFGVLTGSSISPCGQTLWARGPETYNPRKNITLLFKETVTKSRQILQLSISWLKNTKY